ncbi:MAG: ABC transporter permease [Gemmatimonadota bacterium]
MDHLWFDLRQTLRGLKRAKGLTVGAALALAMGLGAVTTLFSIVHGALRELPFDEAHELLMVTRTSPRLGWVDRGGNAFDYDTWSRSVRGFEAVSAVIASAVNLSGDGAAPIRVPGASVAPNAFDVLGVQPLLGRGFTAADAVPGATGTVVIGHGLWQTRFEGDPNILGRTIRVNGEPRTIIGVMRPEFGFPVNQSIWLPLVRHASVDPASTERLTIFGRLADGISREEIAAELEGIAARIARDNPATHMDQGLRAVPLTELEMDRESKSILYIMLLAVSFVLIIACANVANLLLARAAARSRETAIRNALGAQRSRIISQQLFESLAIALLGGIGGLAIAYGAVRVFDKATAGVLEAFWMDFKVDWVVLALATLLIGVTGILAGLAPALRASVISAATILKESTASGLRIGRLSRILVTAELALACGLLVVSGILVKSAVTARSVDFPFAVNDIYTAQLAVMPEVMVDAQRRTTFLRALTDQLSTIPGVEAAGITSVLPARGAGAWSFNLDGRTSERPQDQAYTAVVFVTPEFLDVLDGSVLRGRWFDWSDRAGSLRVAVVNQDWVQRFSADRDPIGRVITLSGEEPATIVGIVSDLHLQDPGDARADGVYISPLQYQPYGVRLMLESRGDVLSLTPDVRARIAQVDPHLPLFEIATLHDAIYADSGLLDVFATLFAVFGLGALFMTSIGLYGVVSFSVTQRTREIGIRMSLGATRRNILGLIIRNGGRPLAIGGALGLLIAIAVSAGLAASGEDVLQSDPLVIAGVFAALGMTAIAALLVPAARAARLDPQAALRSE